MRHIVKFRKQFSVIAITALLFSACKQQSGGSLTNVDDDGGYASDGARMEWATDDAISIADAAGTLYNGGAMRTTSTFGTCATVGVDTIDVPHQLTIRFGDQDCMCLDGKNRRGTIIVYYNGEYTDTNQRHTIFFSNYYVNDNQLTGSIYTQRVDTTVTGNWYYLVSVEDSLVMNGNTLQSQDIIWTGTLIRKWLTGYNTPADRTDDAFSISGSATLTRANGHQFVFDIEAPLQLNLTCNYYVEAGVVDITGNNGPRTLNYGNGTCSGQAQLGITPNVYTIQITP